MKKPKALKQLPRTLDRAQLEQITGGGDGAVAPRDSVSGNATGRRSYKAVDFTVVLP